MVVLNDCRNWRMSSTANTDPYTYAVPITIIIAIKAKLDP